MLPSIGIQEWQKASYKQDSNDVLCIIKQELCLDMDNLLHVSQLGVAFHGQNQ